MKANYVTIKFNGMNCGDTITVNGYTYTAVTENNFTKREFAIGKVAPGLFSKLFPVYRAGTITARNFVACVRHCDKHTQVIAVVKRNKAFLWLYDWPRV